MTKNVSDESDWGSSVRHDPPLFPQKLKSVSPCGSADQTGRRKPMTHKSPVNPEVNSNATVLEVDHSNESIVLENSNTGFFGPSNVPIFHHIEDVIGADLTSADYYFDSYGHFGIHEEMLKDSVRTKAYQNAIYQNSFLFKDKVVLDVGAGTGILSLFCAKSGAKHVYAVECSLMADTAAEIIEVNGFSNVITVLKGKIEEIDLPTHQVDVIVSEWMGYFLLFENMINSVLYARDKWLVPGGVILPDRTSLYLTAIEDADYKHEKIDFWNSVYGFDMSCIKKQAMLEPLIDSVDQNQIVTNSHLIKTMDVEKMVSGDVSFSASFKLFAYRNDFIHALVAFFDVSFTKCHKPISFSTGPKARPTHWKQTVMYLEDVITICEGEALVGKISISPNAKNSRNIDIKLSYSFTGKRCQVSRTQLFKMR